MKASASAPHQPLRPISGRSTALPKKKSKSKPKIKRFNPAQSPKSSHPPEGDTIKMSDRPLEKLNEDTRDSGVIPVRTSGCEKVFHPPPSQSPSRVLAEEELEGRDQQQQQQQQRTGSSKWKKPSPTPCTYLDKKQQRQEAPRVETGEPCNDTAPHITAALQQVVEPIKHALIKDIGTIVKRVTGLHELRGFRLQERGSLYSPLIHHISDADVQMFTKKQGSISFSQCDHLIQFARTQFYLSHIESVRWEAVDGSKVEVPYEQFDLHDSLKGRSGHAAFIVTGIYRFSNGFLIPMDLALICGGQSSEPPQQRCEKIMSKVQQGDFAKVLQKVRALFRKGEARDRLVDSINSDIGKLRFVVKQLEMIKRIMTISQNVENDVAQDTQVTTMTGYLHRVLGLSPAVVSLHDITASSSLTGGFECELQRRALMVLQAHHDVIAAKLLRASGDCSLDEFLFMDESRYYSEEERQSGSRRHDKEHSTLHC